jgi:hypothetical protein
MVDASEEVMLKQTLSELEAKVAVHVGNLARMLLTHRLQVDPRARASREYLCPHCRGKLRIQEEAQARTLSTVFGEVEYKRPYGTCDRCHVSYAPMDCGLGIPPSGGSIKRTKQVCHAAATARSFETAADILREHDGIELSAKQVRIIAEAQGEKLVADAKREVEAFKAGELTFASAPEPKLVVVTADGGRVQTRQAEDGNAWKEDKVGGVYDASPNKDGAAATAEEYEGAKAKIKTYVASMIAWEEFGWMLCVEAMRRGYGRAKDRLFISDGAEALKSLRQMHFKDATFILDWYHAVEHLADCAKAAFVMGSDDCQRWYKRLKQKLWAGDVDAILRAIEKESLRVGKPEPKEPDSSPRVVLHRNLGYFANNREGLDYPWFRAEGWPIGSGIAEGAVKQFGMRLKGSEKFWNGFGFGLGADEMLALCALHRSEDDRWKFYWDRRSQPYVREPKREASDDA